MKRKTFVKRLMGMGISRNTATASADAASRAEIPLLNVAGRIQTMHRIFVGEMAPVKQWRQAFDQALLSQAKMTPRRIHPKAKKNRRLNGLRIDFAAIDEVSRWPKENPPRCDALDALTYSCGIDLAAGPDMTALGGGGHE